MRNNKGFTLVEALVVGAIILILALVAVSALAPKAHAQTTNSNCGGWFEPACGSSTDQQQSQQQSIADNQGRLQLAVPAPTLKDSLERSNISKRLQLFSNPNKTSYIYLVSFGKVMAFYTVKGKITSGNKRLTSSQYQVDSQNCGTGNCAMTMEAPELDGTYGSSSPYIFFWTTEGVYIQWSGDYMLADQPLQLSTPPELVLPVK